MSETCDVDGCENDANTICETKDDNDEVIFEKLFCRNHIEQFLLGER
jgi:hypothetical protein